MTASNRWRPAPHAQTRAALVRAYVSPATSDADRPRIARLYNRLGERHTPNGDTLGRRPVVALSSVTPWHATVMTSATRTRSVRLATVQRLYAIRATRPARTPRTPGGDR